MSAIERIGRIYSELYGDLYNHIRMKVNNLDDVEDIIQETFISFASKFNEIEIHNVRGFLFSHANYKILDHYKKTDKKHIDIEDYLDNKLLSYSNGDKEIRIILQNEISMESGNFDNNVEKSMFDLIVLFGYTYKETAQLLQLSRRQVQYQYGLICKKIIESLKAKGVKNISELSG